MRLPYYAVPAYPAEQQSSELNPDGVDRRGGPTPKPPSPMGARGCTVTTADLLREQRAIHRQLVRDAYERGRRHEREIAQAQQRTNPDDHEGGITR